MANPNNGEPASAPVAGRWYNLTLGPTFKDNPSTKFCTLRYEFKPASIDKNQTGSLHKSKENRVSVEFQNNQPGKPKVTFEGSSEDYKENDGVLFFNGQTFRLERLHRAVKRLRHVRVPGESAAVSAVASTAAATSVGTGMESRSPPVGKISKQQTKTKTAHSLPLEVEKIDIGEDSPGEKPASRASDHLSAPPKSTYVSPKRKITEEEADFNLIFGDDDDDIPNRDSPGENEKPAGSNVNTPIPNDSDDELADVDVSDDVVDKGLNAAEALRAQVNAEEEQQQTSSSSESSESGSRSSGSGSGSGSSSSDSEASDGDSGSSGGDVDI